MACLFQCNRAWSGILLSVALVLFLQSGCTPKKSLFLAAERSHRSYIVQEEILADPSIEKIIEPYRKRLSEEMSRVLCINATPLSRPTPGVESPLANFFADAMLHAAQKEDPETVLAFGTNGALRSSLPAGEITVGHLYELMPFDNQMVILELSGEQVLKLASFIVSSKGQAVAGMRLTQNNSRLTRVEIGGQLLDPKKSYKLATYDYLANGGDEVPGFDQILSRHDFDQDLREAMMDFLQGLNEKQNQSPINLKADGRTGYR